MTSPRKKATSGRRGVSNRVFCFRRSCGSVLFPSYPARPTSSKSGLLTEERTLQSIGIDLIDTSSGGTWIKAQIPVAPGYQGSVLSPPLALLPLSQLTIAPSGPVPFAAQIKKAVPDVLVGAVGLLTSASQIENVLRAGQADVVFVAREVLRNSDFVRFFLSFLRPSSWTLPHHRQRMSY